MATAYARLAAARLRMNAETRDLVEEMPASSALWRSTRHAIRVPTNPNVTKSAVTT
jgi:hypothetical protein